MKWTLTSLAVETRYKDARVVAKSAVSKLDARWLKDLWEDTLVIFLERALIEDAWEGSEPRVVTAQQFESKLRAVAGKFRAKRNTLLNATGSRTSDVGMDGRRFPELPQDFYSVDEKLALASPRNPMRAAPYYRDLFGKELPALWPLLCDCFSGRSSCTGEALIEPQRPIDIVCNTLNGGFEMVERVFTAQCQPAAANGRLVAAVESVSTIIARFYEEQRVIAERNFQATTTLCQSVQQLQHGSRYTAEVLAKRLENLQRGQ